MSHIIRMPNLPKKDQHKKTPFRDRMRRIRHRSSQRTSLIPNMVTVSALCLGLWGFKLALDGRWDWAVGAVLLAVFLDAMDGRIARLLNASSNFGASLDMLCDFANFGVVPAWIMYVFSLKTQGGLGWGACLFFIMCCGLRLARFSTGLYDNKAFFCGLPSPAGGLFALTPLTLSFEFPEVLEAFPSMSFISLCLSGALMISKLPTPAFKNLTMKPGWMMPALAAVGLFFASLIHFPWCTVLAVQGIYLVFLIPFSLYHLRQMYIASKKASSHSV